ncbi:hypothetical protein IV102_31685 [bacterium]|nr:hypothetical protein [bacterium]
MRLCSRAKRLAMSLAELVAGIALAALVLSLVYSIMHAGSSYLRRVQTALELQQACMLAGDTVAHQVGESHAGSMRWCTTPQGLVLASPRDPSGLFSVAPNGDTQWCKLICFYVETIADVPTLVRKEQALVGAPLATPPSIVPSQDSAYFLALPIARHVVARYITEVSGTTTSPCRVRVKAARSERGKPYEIELETQVAPRN